MYLTSASLLNNDTRMKFARDFYKLLRAFCGQRGGQKIMVEKSGVSQPVLSRIISGETKDPGLASISAIVDVLGIASFIDDAPSDCAARLEAALAENARLKSELAAAQGQLAGLEKAYEIALEKLAGNAPAAKKGGWKQDNQGVG